MDSTHDSAWLRDARLIVTGAGNGIGRGIAHRLSEAGAQVVVNDLDPVSCAAVADEIGGYSIPGDASSVAGARELIRGARRELGDIDAFFANAGIETGSDNSERSWERSWDVNVMAHVRAFRELLPGWLERGRGRFVATASAAGMLTMLGSGAYSVTKHAAVAHAEWISATYGHRGITVQCLCPQGVHTQMLPTDGTGEIILGENILTVDQVVDTVLDALHSDEFYILPHPEVAEFAAFKATEPDRWLRGMRRLQDRVDRQEHGH